MPYREHGLNTSRRAFLNRCDLAGAAIAYSPLAQSSAREPDSDRLPITIAGYPYDRVEALIDGTVEVEGCDARFEVASIGEMNTHVFSGPGTREVTEIGLSPFILAFANEGFRDYSLIPVFPLRLFRHRSIVNPQLQQIFADFAVDPFRCSLLPIPRHSGIRM